MTFRPNCVQRNCLVFSFLSVQGLVQVLQYILPGYTLYTTLHYYLVVGRSQLPTFPEQERV